MIILMERWQQRTGTHTDRDVRVGWALLFCCDQRTLGLRTTIYSCAVSTNYMAHMPAASPPRWNLRWKERCNMLMDTHKHNSYPNTHECGGVLFPERHAHALRVLNTERLIFYVSFNQAEVSPSEKFGATFCFKQACGLLLCK